MNDDVISAFCKIFESDANPYFLEADFFGKLIKKAESLKLDGNIFAKYVLHLVLNDENPFSIACECKKITTHKSLYKLALNDAQIIYELINFDFDKILKGNILQFLNVNYLPIEAQLSSQLFSDILYSRNAHELQKFLVEYYLEFGCGQIGANKMLKYSADKKIVGIKNYDEIKFDDIVAYKYQKEQIINNTKAFLLGADAHNMLLVGSRGTGKSSCVKALADMFFNDGLRILELSKDQLNDIFEILNILDNRGQKFIIFLDDLSYEQFETSYKYLKSILEGGIEKKPKNVLFYATSNRRHILSEKWSDKNIQYEDEELHGTDSVNEKLSLSDRFGLTITFGKPTPDEYIEMVLKMAEKENLNLPEHELVKRAREWELNQKGLSGRTARQFINQIILERNLEN